MIETCTPMENPEFGLCKFWKVLKTVFFIVCTNLFSCLPTSDN